MGAASTVKAVLAIVMNRVPGVLPVGVVVDCFLISREV